MYCLTCTAKLAKKKGKYYCKACNTLYEKERVIVNRVEKVSVRFSEKEIKLIKKRAEQAGVTMSEYTRRKLIG